MPLGGTAAQNTHAASLVHPRALAPGPHPTATAIAKDRTRTGRGTARAGGRRWGRWGWHGAGAGRGEHLPPNWTRARTARARPLSLLPPSRPPLTRDPAPPAPPRPHPTQYVEREIVNHSNFVHPHVIQFKEVFLTPTHLAIAMEYAPGGDLFSYVSQRGGLSEDDARWFFQQLVIGLDYCHRLGVVNRDIKLENTLLDGAPRPLLKICDFGYSKHEADSRPKTKVGTPGYTAPEVVRAAASRRYDGRAADVWSAGVMLYTMLFCRYPFERPGDEEDKQRGFQRVLERILRVEYELPASRPVSPACGALLARILVADPASRATVADIMADPWFTAGLPDDAARMNEECLKLRPHDHPGYQTVDAIRAIVREAGIPLGGGAGGGPGGGVDDEAIIEDVINDGSDATLDRRLSSGAME